jgi:hypothetical protein
MGAGFWEGDRHFTNGSRRSGSGYGLCGLLMISANTLIPISELLTGVNDLSTTRAVDV